ncbi:MAG TPA: hypothetical protein VGH36_14750 [Acetobacteraceae bacterium]|jgi:hypothetical protein
MAPPAGSPDYHAVRDAHGEAGFAYQNEQPAPEIPACTSIAVGVLFGLAVWRLIAFIGFELFQYFQYLA